MHPIASILQSINGSDMDNIQFLARLIPQNALPKNHKFFHPSGTKTMIQYYPNRYAPDLVCYDFHATCKIPSNCYHTQIIHGEYLPQDVIDNHTHLAAMYPIRPKGRYVIITYILKRKNFESTKRKNHEDENARHVVKRQKGAATYWSDEGEVDYVDDFDVDDFLVEGNDRE